MNRGFLEQGRVIGADILNNKHLNVCRTQEWVVLRSTSHIYVKLIEQRIVADDFISDSPLLLVICDQTWHQHPVPVVRDKFFNQLRGILAELFEHVSSRYLLVRKVHPVPLVPI